MTIVVRDFEAESRNQREGYAYIAESPLEEAFERQQRQRRRNLSPIEERFERRRTRRDEPASDPFQGDPFGRDRLRREPLEEEDESPLEEEFSQRYIRSDRLTVDDEVEDIRRETDRTRQQQEDIRRAQEPTFDLSPLEREAERQRQRQSQLERARLRQEAIRRAAYENYLRHLEGLARREEEEEEEEEEVALPFDANETRDDATYDPYGDGAGKAVAAREDSLAVERRRLEALEAIDAAYEEATRPPLEEVEQPLDLAALSNDELLEAFEQGRITRTEYLDERQFRAETETFGDERDTVDPFDEVAFNEQYPQSEALTDSGPSLESIGILSYSALRVAQAVYDALQFHVESGARGDFLGLIRMTPFRLDDEIGYLVGGFSADAADSLDYFIGLTAALEEAQRARDAQPLGLGLIIRLHEVPSHPDGTLVEVVYVSFVYDQDTTVDLPDPPQEATRAEERSPLERLFEEGQQEGGGLPADRQDDEEEGRDDEYYDAWSAGKAVASDATEEDEDDTVARAEDLTPQIIEDIYYASIDLDPLSLTYLEYQIVYGSLRPDFAGGPRVGGGTSGTGPGGRLGQQPADEEPEARVLDSESDAEAPLDAADVVDVVDLPNTYYFWDSELGLVRVVNGMFAANRLPIPPVVLPDDTTLYGRKQRFDLFNALPEDVFYDPDIMQFVQIDAEGRRIIQADLSGLATFDDSLLDSIEQRSRAGFRFRENEEAPERIRAEDFQPDLDVVSVYYYWDELLGFQEVSVEELVSGSIAFPLPPVELPDAETAAGQRARAQLFLSLPENRYYDPAIRQWITIDDDGRHIIDANLTGWQPGRTLVGYREDGTPIFATITTDADRQRGEESLDRYASETYIGDIYFDETTGQWIGLDEQGRPVVTDEDGYPIPLEDLDLFEPQTGTYAQTPEEYRASLRGRVDLEANAARLEEGQFFPYIYDPLQDVWIAFDRNNTPLLLAEAPDYTWDPETGYFTLLNEETGEFEIYNQEGVQIDHEGNPIEPVEEEDLSRPELNLPTGEGHSRFDPDFDLPITGSALRVARAVLAALGFSLEGELQLSIELRTYQEGGQRAGYLIGVFTPEADNNPDYDEGLAVAFEAGEGTRQEIPLGDLLNMALLEVPSSVPGVFVTVIEIWFNVEFPEEEEDDPEQRDPRAPEIDDTDLGVVLNEFIYAAQLEVAFYIEQILRDNVPVRTGALQASIAAQEVTPGGYLSDRRIEIGARVFYAPFVAGYRQGLGLALSQGRAYAAEFGANIFVSPAQISIERDPNNRYSGLGPGITVSLGERPDFRWGTADDNFSLINQAVIDWFRQFFTGDGESTEFVEEGEEAADLPYRSRLGSGLFHFPTSRQARLRLRARIRRELGLDDDWLPPSDVRRQTD